MALELQFFFSERKWISGTILGHSSTAVRASKPGRWAYRHPRFIDADKEAQGGQVTCPGEWRR